MFSTNYIRHKKAFRLFIVLVILIVLGATFLLYDISVRLQRLQNNTLVGLALASAIKEEPEQMQLAIYELLASRPAKHRSAERREHFQKLQAAFEQAVTQYEGTVLREVDRDNLQRVRAAYARYAAAADDFWKDSGEGSVSLDALRISFLDFNESCDCLYNWKRDRSGFLTDLSNSRLTVAIRLNLTLLGLLFLGLVVLTVTVMAALVRHDDPANF